MIKLAWPMMLLLLPLPLLVHRALPAVRAQAQRGLRVPFFNRLNTCIAEVDMRQVSTEKNWFLILLWVLLVVAAARPEFIGAPIELQRTGRGLMLAVDVSGSMQIPDLELHGMQAQRLDVVKETGRKFVQQRRGDRLGLILFASQAYLQTPLTFDRNAVVQMLADASIGLAGQETAIGDAIGLAVKRLIQQPKESRVIILLTDGANNTGVADPVSAAKIAAENNIRIYTIGLGAEEMVVPSIIGMQVVNPSAELDQKTLKKIAELTGGLYFRAKDTQALQQVYRELDKLEPVVADKMIYRPVQPLYPWLVAIALLLSLLVMMRHLIFWHNKSATVNKLALEVRS